MSLTPSSDPAFAANITRAASQQTYLTIRFLADRNRVDDAFRAYAYFRWVDDWLDQEARSRDVRLAFSRRQQDLIIAAETGSTLPEDLKPEEMLVVELLQGESDQCSGLHAYIHNLMDVMVFDAERRGRLIRQSELEQYTRWLAVAVTEAMHYFIGHNCSAPRDERRYLAVGGAHITHMLRDTHDDIAAGYYNIPQEIVEGGGLEPGDVEHPVYRAWVQQRVDEARACFTAGREYLAEVQSFRCRSAAYAYVRRFEAVLNQIERDDYRLRPSYPELDGLQLETIGWALWMAFTTRPDANE